MPEPLAYFLTWTTKGTWLHGDERGSVHRTQNSVGQDFIAPNHAWNDYDVREHAEMPLLLTLDMCVIVDDTILAHCDYRKWSLHAKNVRTNHVHVIVTSDKEPDTTMDELKAWCTRRLRLAGLVGQDVQVWTPKGSKRQLWNERSLAAAIRYVNDGQGYDLI